MSRKIQRFVAAMTMAAALLLVVPAPSWATQVHKPAADHSLGLLAQAWSWLESLLGQSKGPAVQRKDIMTTTTPLPPPPNQGPAIDPDGAK
ncbi:MAG TPA: hypothetical protein VGP73_01230 [Thermoanaerobaculia bacterium]